MSDLINTPKAFISYSWTSEAHTEWVRGLAEQLVNNGVDVVLDKWDLKEGHDINYFMESNVKSPDIHKVLIICDKGYKQKADDRQGGVGRETYLITSEVYGKATPEKFIPIVAELDEDGKAPLPNFLHGRLYIDMSNGEKYTIGYERLLRNIYNKPYIVRPEIGQPPEFILNAEVKTPKNVVETQDSDDFVFIKGGSFLMGSPEREFDRENDEIQHQVIAGDFYMSKYPVTVAQFDTFIREGNYRTDDEYKLQQGKQHPVTYVSWNDATAYCQWLSRKENKAIRLPTEAEWEYACRAGTVTPFNTGNNLTTEQANYDGNFPYGSNPKGRYIGKTTSVGSYPPNAWGLYDMHGNVFEWCMDWYGKVYYNKCKQQGIIDNPKGPENGWNRVLRGGSWGRYAECCRSAYRYSSNPSYCCGIIGFRLVFVP